MKIAISGLGRMGMQIVRKLVEDGHIVIAHDISKSAVDEARSHGASAAVTPEEVVASFKEEQLVLWMMVPSDVVDATLDSWMAIVPKGSIIIDGGNSNFNLTKERAKRIKGHGGELLDVGTSGGIWGYQNGFAMMAGGNLQAFKIVEPILQTLAKPEGAYHYFGESGSGHFVKMTHNAIEYGMMESLAEGYQLLKEGPYKDIDLGAAGEVWQHHSVVTSWLNELCRDALKENPTLDGIDGHVAESGEARWALETTKEYGIPSPSIQASFDVRLLSQNGTTNFATKLLSAMRNKFGGHKINK
jgi:6-phosphogluconate dehydrogenase